MSFGFGFVACCLLLVAFCFLLLVLLLAPLFVFLTKTEGSTRTEDRGTRDSNNQDVDGYGDNDHKGGGH